MIALATELHSHCWHGHVEHARLCLERDADVDPVDEHGRTPLVLACWQGHADVVKLMLERGANVNRAGFYGATPLYAACYSGNTDAARLCIEHGADMLRVNGVGGVTPLDAARSFARRSSGWREGGDGRIAAWLERVQEVGGWARYLSEPRYKLVVLRELVARGRARRERAFHGNELALDFLFPGQPCPKANKQARRIAHLPDDLFTLIARYYWCGDVTTGATMQNV